MNLAPDGTEIRDPLMSLSRFLPSTPLASPLALCIAFLATRALGQEPQDVHPWQKNCGEYGCFVGYFCHRISNLCELCPGSGGGGRDANGVSEQDCLDLDLGLDASTNSSRAEDCLEECVKAQVGDECSDGIVCQEGASFCNYEEAPSIEDEHNATTSGGGICQECKADVSECLFDDSIMNDFGLEDCILCDLRVCVPLHFSATRIEGENGIASNAMQGSPSTVARGQLVDCTNLVHVEETSCNNNTDVSGKVCLVNDFTRNTLYVDVVHKCTSLGGSAVIFYGDFSPRTSNDDPWTGSLGWQGSFIPSVSISYNDGKRLHEERLGSVAQVNTSDVGDACFKNQFCSDILPCVGTNDGSYCDYKWSGGEEGFCRACPTDDEGNPSPLSCFFSIEDWGKVTGQKAVESCAKVCASSLTFPDCKFCPQDVTGFDFGVDSDEERCEFCQEQDVLFPAKEFPLFGANISCWQVQKFFQTVDVPADAANCQLAQAFNYVCGCSGSGYGGASTATKQKVLTWLPRVMAILSFLSSSFIIFDASSSQEKRERLQNQLLIALSLFDIFGSAAYAFTTLPIPENYTYGPVYGAKGNDASCTAQGFFIQIGTISAYTNVSLSLYYLLVIKYGWSESRVKKLRVYLFFVPILVGLSFAFAGIPFYDPLPLWCNNTASYWPDIPVAVAIGLATFIMGTVCWDVYSKERRTRKYHSGRTGRARLSTKVFWQSFWYLLAFYLTWPVYLALQYAWAGGESFTQYGFILTAGTMVPLQGFWNMLVYIRPRHFHRAAIAIRSSVTAWSLSVLTRRGSNQGSFQCSVKQSKLTPDSAGALRGQECISLESKDHN